VSTCEDPSEGPTLQEAVEPSRLERATGLLVALGMALICVAIMASNGVSSDYAVEALVFLGLAAWQATELRK
jgi:hypothetical protein